MTIAFHHREQKVKIWLQKLFVMWKKKAILIEFYNRVHKNDCLGRIMVYPDAVIKGNNRKYFLCTAQSTPFHSKHDVEKDFYQPWL